MRSITTAISALIVIAITGCGQETRASWENSRQFRHLKPIEVPADPQQPGTTRIVYPDNKPVQDFGALGHPEQVTTRYEHGIHINAYAGTGPDAPLVSHRWQRSEPLKP